MAGVADRGRPQPLGNPRTDLLLGRVGPADVLQQRRARDRCCADTAATWSRFTPCSTRASWRSSEPTPICPSGSSRRCSWEPAGCCSTRWRAAGRSPGRACSRPWCCCSLAPRSRSWPRRTESSSCCRSRSGWPPWSASSAFRARATFPACLLLIAAVASQSVGLAFVAGATVVLVQQSGRAAVTRLWVVLAPGRAVCGLVCLVPALGPGDPGPGPARQPDRGPLVGREGVRGRARGDQRALRRLGVRRWRAVRARAAQGRSTSPPATCCWSCSSSRRYGGFGGDRGSLERSGSRSLSP